MRGTGRSIAALVFVCSLLGGTLGLVGGCKNTATTEPGFTEDSLRYTVALFTHHLYPLSSGRHYELWFKFDKESNWKDIGPVSVMRLYAQDSSIIGASFKSGLGQSKPSEVLISVETDTTSGMVPLERQPSAKLLWGSVNAGDTSGSTAMTGVNGIGIYGKNISGKAIFTTTSSDTSQAKHEFYLAKKQGSDLVASLQNLPTTSPEWRYALWVIDSNFYPVHRFFFGTFTNGNGHDSDSANDHYPFPGGYTGAAINSAGNQILVTLEPTFDLVHLQKFGPSPFTVLKTRLMQFISYNQENDLTNVTSTGIPSATLTYYYRHF